MLATKGFLDSVVSISEDSADVVVNASELTEANRAQIEDIVTRKNRRGSAEYCNHSSICRREIIDLRRLVTLR